MTVEQRDVLVLLPTREQLRLAVGVSAGDQGAERVEAVRGGDVTEDRGSLPGIPAKADISPERKRFLFQVIELRRYCNRTFHLQIICYRKELK